LGSGSSISIAIRNIYAQGASTGSGKGFRLEGVMPTVVTPFDEQMFRGLVDRLSETITHIRRHFSSVPPFSVGNISMSPSLSIKIVIGLMTLTPLTHSGTLNLISL